VEEEQVAEAGEPALDAEDAETKPFDSASGRLRANG
jgi:hypothetical protein